VTPIEPRPRFWVAAAAVIAATFCAAVVAIPVAERSGMVNASWLRLALRPACHQIPDRCLDLGAGPLPVCARCAGLYAGGLAGLLVTAVGGRRFRPGLRTVAAAAAPSVVDFILGVAGLPSLGNWPRFAVAAVPGLLIGLLLADAIGTIAAPREPPPRGGSIT
jgi:uncharacterized membrane protein